jgi:hypothetical protein
VAAAEEVQTTISLGSVSEEEKEWAEGDSDSSTFGLAKEYLPTPAMSRHLVILQQLLEEAGAGVSNLP